MEAAIAPPSSGQNEHTVGRDASRIDAAARDVRTPAPPAPCSSRAEIQAILSATTPMRASRDHERRKHGCYHDPRRMSDGRIGGIVENQLMPCQQGMSTRIKDRDALPAAVTKR